MGTSTSHQNKENKVKTFIDTVGDAPRKMMSIKLGPPNEEDNEDNEDCYHPTLEEKKISHVRTSLPGSERARDTQDFMKGMHKCLIGVHSINPPLWGSPSEPGLLHINHEIFLTYNKQDATPQPGRWMNTETRTNCLYTKERYVEVGCVEKTGENMHQFWHMAFPLDLPSQTKGNMIRDWGKIVD